MSTYYNVCAEHIHQANGEEKSIYKNVGTLKVTQNGGWFLHLYHQPDVTFRVFGNEDNLPIIE